MRFNRFSPNAISDDEVEFLFELDTTCPGCNKGIQPNVLSTYVPNTSYGYCMYDCPICYEVFTAKFSTEMDITIDDFDAGLNASSVQGTFVDVFPKNVIFKSFDPHIETLSPDFITIYNQAEHAQQLGLEEISGIAYRKSLEFLVKDYAISISPKTDVDKISNLKLGQCINKFLPNERLKSLATASAWIGNDEAHHFKKHEDKDIYSLIKYIDALVTFLTYELIAEEAESFIQNK